MVGAPGLATATYVEFADAKGVLLASWVKFG
jgi:hypothetical protein